ncbi:MAG: hypothetical protein AAFX02_07430, partial [Pseudomonadota bacterium]
ECICSFNDETQPIEPHPGVADVRIRDKRCCEFQTSWPVGRRHDVTLNPQKEWFYDNRICWEAGYSEGDADALQEKAA